MPVSQREMRTFDDFWPYYVNEHSKPRTRALHATGTLVGTGLAVGLLASSKWWLLPLAFVPGYAVAWASHFFVEHNRPATFQHPLWSLAADYKMLGMMLTGRMSEEVERARAQASNSAA